MATVTQLVAKRDFLPICREVIQSQQKSYVRDRSGNLYLTLDPIARRLTSPAVDVTAQFFKDNFSRMSSLVKDGLCFRLTLRRLNQPLYARRHARYNDPVDVVIEAWRERVVASALLEREQNEVLSAIRNLNSQVSFNQENVIEAINKFKRGIARMAIGHKPFEEGEMSDGILRIVDGGD